MMAAPEAPMGCPRAVAPPCTFTLPQHSQDVSCEGHRRTRRCNWMYLVGSQAVLVMNMMMYSDKVDSKALNMNAFEDACEEKLAVQTLLLSVI